MVYFARSPAVKSEQALIANVISYRKHTRSVVASPWLHYSGSVHHATRTSTVSSMPSFELQA
ncbi:hypothetical protein EI94DRAFT_1735311 [Lactarius quietus]|nr:hypothetical protein EI94DRAFT_1735311 [Lactarius quietus]